MEIKLIVIAEDGTARVVVLKPGEPLELAPGETLALTIGGDHYDAVLSTFLGAFSSGDKLYAHVDSADEFTSYGSVNESHEIMGGTYNNITEAIVP